MHLKLLLIWTVTVLQSETIQRGRLEEAFSGQSITICSYPMFRLVEDAALGELNY